MTNTFKSALLLPATAIAFSLTISLESASASTDIVTEFMPTQQSGSVTCKPLHISESGVASSAKKCTIKKPTKVVTCKPLHISESGLASSAKKCTVTRVSA